VPLVSAYQPSEGSKNREQIIIIIIHNYLVYEGQKYLSPHILHVIDITAGDNVFQKESQFQQQQQAAVKSAHYRKPVS
jgi:hypothetical protein